MVEHDALSATREAYDAAAPVYAQLFSGGLRDRPLDRAILSAFAEVVSASGDGQVADLGCGPGYITAYLDELGLAAFGVDASPAMIKLAGQAYPGLRFDVGSMLALDLPDGALGGVVAWYSTIHLPDDRLPEALAEFSRVLAPGGYALLAFQARDEPRHMTEALGHPISLEFHQRQPERVAELLGQVGLMVRARLLREPDVDGDFRERTQQAFVLAGKQAS